MFAALRPLHWLKNLLIFAPAFFSGNLTNCPALLQSTAAFVIFCAASSGMYLLNNVLDRKADAVHPRKKNRPLASGRAKSQTYLFLSLILEAAALTAAILFGRIIAIYLLSYIFLITSYSIFLKKVPVINLILIASGMLLRVYAGAAAIGVEVSPWVLPCLFLLSMYITLGKRIFDGNSARGWQKILFSALGLAAFLAYLFYCVQPGNIASHLAPRTSHFFFHAMLWLTSLPVLLGIARYHQIMYRRDGKKEHLETIATDSVMILSLLTWLLLFGVIIYII